MADRLLEEGMAFFRRGQRDAALEKFREAAASYAAAEDPTGQGEALNNAAVIYRLQRRWQEAADAFDRARTLFREAGEVARQGQVLGNLGDLYARRGDDEAAARLYGEGAALLAQAGEHDNQAQILRALSLLRLRQRRFLEAMMLMDASLEARPRLSLSQRLFRPLLSFALRLLTGGREPPGGV
ncbi:MAG: tetratricopeptide repeat protein [Candidatus Promineifilaceae bacterium]|nr:tetratricopeptide repeat protein [Candidatus Promineifilaceae bacterium]